MTNHLDSCLWSKTVLDPETAPDIHCRLCLRSWAFTAVGKSSILIQLVWCKINVYFLFLQLGLTLSCSTVTITLACLVFR